MDYEFYNKHYLKTREDGAIVDAWSDGPLRDKTVDGAVCFNERGGYQLRLIVDGVLTEENPPIFEEHGIPIYKYMDGEIKRRTAEEVQKDVDAIPPTPPSPMEQMRADLDFVIVMTDLL